MHLELNVTQKQSQVISQSQIQSLQILALDNNELYEYLMNEYLENPLIDCTSEPDKLKSAAFQSSQELGTGSCHTSESENHLQEAVAENPYVLKYYLLDQLNLKKYSIQENEVMEFLIECLDHNGFFTMSASEVSKLIHVSKHTVKKCLELLASLKPDGIFSPDLQHCLLRQLDVQKEYDFHLRTIIKNHLEDVAQGRISTISRTLNLSTAQVKKYIAAIKKLNPRPLMGLMPSNTEYMIPDIIVSYRNNEWHIELNDKWIGNYCLSTYYLNMMKTVQDPELLAYFNQKLENTRFIIRSIEQRRTTILRISQAIVSFQSDYFLGKGPLKPMKIADIAQMINMHPSTVSRGIKGKYMQYQRKTIAVKSLFFSGFVLNGDEFETTETVKVKMKDLIELENHENPYSDQEISEILGVQNISIARRTVAKYRNELGIGTTYERKYISPQK